MPTPAENFRDMLESRSVTACNCWLVTLKSGVSYGFTDHDNFVTVGTVNYSPVGGFNASAIRADTNLAVDSQDLEAAINSDRIRSEDLEAGLWDGATITMMHVDWMNPANYVIKRQGTIGKITKYIGYFVAEFRNLAHELNYSRGRYFQSFCDVQLGSPRCKFGLTNPSYSGTGIVGSKLSDSSFVALGIGSYAANLFTDGYVTFTTGAKISQEMGIARHFISGADVVLVLKADTTRGFASGDNFSIVAGCNGSFSDCKNKFSNAINFQGFPSIPASDTIMRIAFPDRKNTGKPLR